MPSSLSHLQATPATGEANTILDNQIIRLKRGRMNSFGFEPAWNAYFDFYLSSKYTQEPLLKLEDVTFHLFLRKNLNDQDPAWQMPSVRQIKRRLGIGQERINAMIERLVAAHLLEKVSGERQGEKGENLSNTYLLSDPIQNLEDFLQVASASKFAYALHSQWQTQVERAFTLPSPPVPESGTPPVPESGTPPVPESGTPPVPKSGTHKQTYIKQTSKKQTLSTTSAPASSTEADDTIDDDVVVLINLGISKRVAKQLAKTYGEAAIHQKVEYLHFLEETNPNKIENPCGWLVNAIREEWSAPDGFKSVAERAAEEAEKEQQAADHQRQVEEEEVRLAERRVQKAEARRQGLALLHARHGTTEADLAVWEQVLVQLQHQIPAPTFSLLQAVQILRCEEDQVRLGVKNPSEQGQLQNHPGTRKLLMQALSRVVGKPVDVQVEMLSDA